MPIRITCRCGQSLSVPDTMAGKSGKCPKCSEVIRIPSASPPAKAATSQPAPAAKSGLDQLFSEAGLEKKKGPECPSCRAAIAPGAVLCVQCGFNLATGQKVKGLAVAVNDDGGNQVNRQLKEAARSIKKEKEDDEKIKFSGSPWWVSLAVVLGIITIIVFGVIIVEGLGKDAEGESLRAPDTTLKGKIQRLPPFNLLLVVGSLVSGMVVIMAWIATWTAAFRNQVVQGLLCFFIPIYSHYYAFANRRTMGNTMKILLGWTVAFIVIMIFMMTTRTLQFMLK